MLLKADVNSHCVALFSSSASDLWSVYHPSICIRGPPSLNSRFRGDCGLAEPLQLQRYYILQVGITCIVISVYHSTNALHLKVSDARVVSTWCEDASSKLSPQLARLFTPPMVCLPSAHTKRRHVLILSTVWLRHCAHLSAGGDTAFPAQCSSRWRIAYVRRKTSRY